MTRGPIDPSMEQNGKSRKEFERVWKSLKSEGVKLARQRGRNSIRRKIFPFVLPELAFCAVSPSTTKHSTFFSLPTISTITSNQARKSKAIFLHQSKCLHPTTITSILNQCSPQLRRCENKKKQDIARVTTFINKCLFFRQ